MLFHSWGDIWRVAGVAAVMFFVVVALLRIVGQVALAKMSGFDVVFTVTLGSLIATVILTRSVTISEALTALIVLLALQGAVRMVQARWLPFHHVVRESPRVVLWEGELLEERLLASSISADEVRAAVRRKGLRSLSEALAVVLENDGDWSVVPKSDGASDESAFFGLPLPGRPDTRGATDHPPTPASPYRLP
jgi:uncharacterized membrane protein YcaP (DUF421 family)